MLPECPAEQTWQVSSSCSLCGKWTMALEVEVLAADGERFDYNVTRCAYAEMYHQMGLGEIGHLLSCNRDAHFIAGYDDRVQLTRSSTIMSGSRCCDFRYKVKGAEAAPSAEAKVGSDPTPESSVSPDRQHFAPGPGR